MRIGIFGGSFDPVHRGHLKLAFEAASELNLSKVFFVPSYQSPLKGRRPLLSPASRVRLLQAALKGSPFFEVSRVELRRRGVSYTVDTLKHFRKRFGKTAELYFLAGSDVIAGLGRWKSFPEVLRLCRFVVLTRPGHTVRRVPKGVWTLRLDPVNVSSTEIRARLTGGQARLLATGSL